MEIEILKFYQDKFVKLVYYLDEEHTQTASIKGTLILSGDSFIVQGSYNEISGLIKDVKSCKRWLS